MKRRPTDQRRPPAPEPPAPEPSRRAGARSRTARSQGAARRSRRRRAAGEAPKPARPSRRADGGGASRSRDALKVIAAPGPGRDRLHRRRGPRRRRRPARATRIRRGAGAGAGGEGAAPRARHPQASEELGYPAFATNNTTRVGGSDPASNAAGVALAVFPSTTPGPAPGGGHAGRRRRLGGGDRRLGADGGAGPGAAPVLRPPTSLPDPTAEALAALDPQGDSADRRRRPSRSATSPAPAARRGRRSPPATPRPRRRRSRSCATDSSAPPRTRRHRPQRRARLRDAGGRLGGALRRPGPLRRHRRAAGGDRGGTEAPHRACPSTSSGPPRRSPRRCSREIAKIDEPGQAGLRRGPGRQRDRLRPLRRRRLRLERQRPRPRLRRRPQRLAARRGRRGAALGLGHLGAVAAHRQRRYAAGRRCAATCSTSSPATPPTRPAPSTTTCG